MKYFKTHAYFINEAKRGTIHSAAKKASYPVTLVAMEKGKVVNQKLIGTPMMVPAAFNEMQKEFPNAKISVESKTGETVFIESVNEAKFFRLPAKLNAMYELKNAVDYIVGKHENGDDYKPAEMKTIEALIKKIKGTVKSFTDPRDVKGTFYESAVTEGGKINLKADHLSSSEYQKAKKLKAFNSNDWVWNSNTSLYDRVGESAVTEDENTIGGLNKMANTDLERIADYADMIKDRMSQGQTLDAWMYSKISDSVKSLNSVHDTMDGNDGVIESLDTLCEATVEMDTMDPGNKDFLKFLKKNRVKIISKEMQGPGGGNPVITMQGKRKDLENVLADEELGWGDADLAEFIEESVNEATNTDILDLVDNIHKVIKDLKSDKSKDKTKTASLYNDAKLLVNRLHGLVESKLANESTITETKGNKAVSMAQKKLDKVISDLKDNLLKFKGAKTDTDKETFKSEAKRLTKLRKDASNNLEQAIQDAYADVELVVMENYDTDKRKEMAEKGLALPDGSFPIKNLEDLKNAIQAYGRSKDQAAAAKFIAKRAKALGAEDLIPDTEDFQKSLKEDKVTDK
jgi:LAS superfamily LD-carboxypeptidase LdcB